MVAVLVAATSGCGVRARVPMLAETGPRPAIPKSNGRAAIWEIDRATGRHRVYATGLRNPVGLAWQPDTQMLWTAVNERDELGADLVPDYVTSVRDGGFYGWPYSYYGRHVHGTENLSAVTGWYSYSLKTGARRELQSTY